MTFNYPKPELKLHRPIIKKLTSGVFIFAGTKEYDILMEFEDYYRGLMKECFDFELVRQYEIFYCQSLTRKTEKTKNIMVFVAILMYELNNRGKDPVSTIQTTEFSYEQVREMLSESVQFSACVDTEKYGTRFFNELHNFGLIHKLDGDRFVFTKAIDIFLNEYQDIIQNLEIDDNQPENQTKTKTHPKENYNESSP